MDSNQCRMVKLCGEGQDSISPDQERMIESIIDATDKLVLEDSFKHGSEDNPEGIDVYKTECMYITLEVAVQSWPFLWS